MKKKKFKYPTRTLNFVVSKALCKDRAALCVRVKPSNVRFSRRERDTATTRALHGARNCSLKSRESAAANSAKSILTVATRLLVFFWKHTCRGWVNWTKWFISPYQDDLLYSNYGLLYKDKNIVTDDGFRAGLRSFQYGLMDQLKKVKMFFSIWRKLDLIIMMIWIFNWRTRELSQDSITCVMKLI